MMVGAEVGVIQSRAKKCGRPLEDGKGKDSLLEPPEERQPC